MTLYWATVISGLCGGSIARPQKEILLQPDFSYLDLVSLEVWALEIWYSEQLGFRFFSSSRSADWAG